MPAEIIATILALFEEAIAHFPPFAIARAKAAISKREDILAKEKFPELEIEKE